MLTLIGGDKITQKQKVFADAYVKSGDETASYIEAYGTKNASTASKQGSLLLKKPEIKEYIDKTAEEERTKTAHDPDRILELLYAIAFTSPADFVRIDTEDGKQKILWKDTDSLPEAAKRAIAVIKNTPSGICIETLDRMKAIDMLMKYTQKGAENAEGVVIEGRVE